MLKTDQFEQIGQVLKSNGTDGQVVIGLRGILPEDISETEPVFIYFDELPVPFFFDNIQQRGGTKLLARLTDIRTLEDAEELVGRGVFLPAEDFEEEGQDFTGWTLISGDFRASIEGIEDIPGNPCLIVNCEQGEVLVPLHEDLIINIDESSKVLEMNIPDGLM